MRGVIAFCLMVVASLSAQAAESIEKIEACMRANIPETLQVREFEISATDKTGGVRTLSGRLHARLDNSKIKAVMRVDAPSDMRGSAYLVLEPEEAGKSEEIYVYIPAIQKIRRVNGGMRDSSLFGTDLSYSDVKQITYAFSGNTLKLEKEDAIEKRPVWLLSMAPDPTAGGRFDKVLAWIDQKTCMVLKADFQQSGTVRKRFETSPKFLTQSGKHWYFTEGRIEDLQEKTSTKVRFVGVKSDTDIADRLFNPRMFHVGN